MSNQFPAYPPPNRGPLRRAGQLASQAGSALSVGRDLLGQLSAPGTLALRVGDAEREQMAAVLGEHYAAGRLTYEEYDERLQLAMTAVTRGDLAPLLRDLPGYQVALVAPRLVVAPRPPRFQPSVPFLPVLIGLIGLSILTGQGWLFWLGLGAFLVWRHRERRQFRALQSKQSASPQMIEPPLFRQ